MESENEDQASDALTVIGEARAAAADRLVTPWWYHPILGFLVSAYVIGFSLGNTLVRAVSLVLFLGGCLLLVRAYRRLTGVWISGFDAGPASRWAWILGGATATAMLGSLIIAWTTSLVWPTWCIAVAAGVGVVIVGRRFDVALRAQLRAGA